MNKPLSLAILIAGIVLLVYGISASDSIGSEISRIFTGKPTDETVWLLLGGIIVTAVGAAGLMRGSKSV